VHRTQPQPLIQLFPQSRFRTILKREHCSLYWLIENFNILQSSDSASAFCTTFLAKHFSALVWEGLGLDRHPQLRDTYFSNYTRVVLLSQTTDPKVVEFAEAAAAQLGLSFEHRHVGVQGIANSIPVTF
jgi:hypothetical protein